MAYDENKPKKEKRQKSFSMMTLQEIREQIAEWLFQFHGRTDRNTLIVLRWLNMSAEDFSDEYKKFFDKRADRMYENAGAMRNGAVIIPAGWGNLPILYEVLALRIEEMNRIGYAKKQKLAPYEMAV